MDATKNLPGEGLKAALSRNYRILADPNEACIAG